MSETDSLRAPLRGERRRLTVMFCDLVGSTELSERLDPEEMADILRAYYDACGEVVESYGGAVIRYQGDGVLIYFGYPAARDDDPVQAVRAGLALTEAVAKVSERVRFPGVTTAAHIAIHTGLVVVGEVATGRADEVDEVVGETPNLASRLERLGGPNDVVISDATQALVRGYFEFEPLGPHELRGISRPVSVFRVVGETSASSRLDVGGRFPMRGRTHELSILLGVHARATRGESPVVVVSGEPGVGKSRLVRELEAQTPSAWLEARCSPYRVRTPFSPFLDLIRRELGLPAGSPDVAQLRDALGDEEIAAGLAPMFGAVAQGDLQRLTAEAARDRSAREFAVWLQRLAGDGVCVLVIENVHWADASSIDLVERVAMQRPAHVAIVLLTRSDPMPSLDLPTDAVEIVLGRLDSSEIREIAGAVIGVNAIGEGVVERIVERAEGVPLFAEELARAAVESVQTPGDAAVPATLHDTIMSRLDRLGPAKEVAQIAAVIGRRVRPDLLAELTGEDDTTLHRHLDRLVEAEILVSDPDGLYAFRHALVRDAAYDSLLRRSRQRLHGLIADMLSVRPEVADTEPELVAHHYANAADAAHAIDFWVRASSRAGLRWAYAEAREHVEQALALVDQLLPSGERDRLEERLQTARAIATMRFAGHASAEVGAALSRAAELADARKSVVSRWLIRSMLVPHLQAVGRFDDALHEARLAREPIPGRSEPLVPHAMGAEGATLVWQGRFAEGIDSLEGSRAGYLALDDPTPLALDGFSRDTMYIGVGSLLGFAYWLRGDDDVADERFREVIARADELGHPDVRLLPLLPFGIVLQLAGDAEGLAGVLDDVRTIAGSDDAVPAWAEGLAGWLEHDTGRIGAALACLGADGHLQTRPYLLALLGERQLDAGDLDGAGRTLTDAITLCGRTGERFIEAELHRLLGRARMLTGDQTAAAAAFDRAAAIADEQGALRLLARIERAVDVR